MDFSLDLRKGFLTSVEEFRQTLFILLQNPKGTFIQGPYVGSFVSPHLSDNDLLEEQVRQTLNQLSGVSIQDVSVSNGNEVTVKLTYKNNFIKLKYLINNEDQGSN